MFVKVPSHQNQMHFTQQLCITCSLGETNGSRHMIKENLIGVT
jgi:hypothetical protein